MRAPWRGGGQRHLLGAERLHGVEALPAALEQDADQVDHARRRRAPRPRPSRIAQVGLHRMDLADPAERLQVAGEVGPAHRDADAVAALGQRAHHVAAEEARAAEDGDQRVDWLAVMDAVHAARSRALATGCRRNTGSVPGCTGRRDQRSIDKAKGAPLCVAPT